MASLTRLRLHTAALEIKVPEPELSIQWLSSTRGTKIGVMCVIGTCKVYFYSVLDDGSLKIYFMNRSNVYG